jgi:hypothetical protein
MASIWDYQVNVFQGASPTTHFDVFQGVYVAIENEYELLSRGRREANVAQHVTVTQHVLTECAQHALCSQIA